MSNVQQNSETKKTPHRHEKRTNKFMLNVQKIINTEIFISNSRKNKVFSNFIFVGAKINISKTPKQQNLSPTVENCDREPLNLCWMFDKTRKVKNLSPTVKKQWNRFNKSMSNVRQICKYRKFILNSRKHQTL